MYCYIFKKIFNHKNLVRLRKLKTEQMQWFISDSLIIKKTSLYCTASEESEGKISANREINTK